MGWILKIRIETDEYVYEEWIEASKIPLPETPESRA